MSEERFEIYQDSIRRFESNRIFGVKSETNSLEPYMTFKEAEKCCNLLNEQQSFIGQLQEENLYKNFKLKSVDDLKKLKDIFEICMVLIDGAIADEDLELGYESVFQFERRIKKLDESRIWEMIRRNVNE